MGRHFIIKTDHRSLKNLLTQVIQTPEQQEFLYKLLGFDFEILYKPGKENTAADGLSRQFEKIVTDSQTCSTFYSVVVQKNEVIEILKKEIIVAKWEQKLKEEMLQGKRKSVDYTFLDGLVFYKSRIWVPKDSNIIIKILETFHASIDFGRAYRI